MLPDESAEVEEIFHGAAERAPAERARFLEEACRGRPALRREVESLLEAQERVEDFLEEPRLGLEPPAEPVFDFVGRRIGPFRVTRFLAEGGMGIVYEAEQDSPRRRVALKLLKGSAHSSAARRFLDESEILARLVHPGIAHVYEAGVHRAGTSAFPHFAMEFVEGARPITRFCREEGLDSRRRLRLFLRVCDAVQHGHGRGIIHRDLKPSNLLVDPGGNPKVIDFGVARATNADLAATTLRTDPGRIVGTLQYMSPEQCAGDPHALDVRSDVYSLGLVLYELLCGEPPYDVSKTSVVGALRLIREHAPRRPRAVRTALEADLETILLKALEKEPDRRYASATDLASDVRRFLEDEPIAARPASRLYRFRKRVARNRLASALSAAFLVAILAMVGIVTRLYFDAESSRRLAELRAEEVQRYDRTLERIIRAFRHLPNAPGEDAGEGVEAVRFLESLAGSVRAQFHGRARASLLAQVANALFSWREEGKARALFREAFAEGERDPLDEDLLHAVHSGLAYANRRLGDLKAAEEHFRVLVTLAVDPVEKATALLELASLRARGSDFREARAAHEAAVAIARTLLGDRQGALRLGGALSALGRFRKTEGSFPEAEEALTEAIALLERTPEKDGPIAFGAKNGLASLRYRQGRYGEALALYSELEGPAAALASRSPAAVLHNRNNVALMLGSMGRFEEAIPEFEEVLERKREILGEGDPTVGHTRHDYAQVLFRKGDLGEAEAHARAALESFERATIPEWDEFLGSIAHLLGEIELARDRPEAAEPLLRDAIEAHLRWLPEDNYRIAEVRCAIGECLVRLGRGVEVDPAVRRAPDTLAATYGADDPRTRLARERVRR